MECRVGIFLPGATPSLTVGFLITAMLFGSGSDTVAPKLLRIKLAIEDAPLLAVFQNFFFHRANLFPGFHVPLFFFAKLVRKYGDDILANCVAVFDEFDFIAAARTVLNLMDQPTNFSSVKSH